MTTLCIYHNDADGRASAAIVRRALGKDINLYEMKYGDSLPMEELLHAKHLIIVDFSLPREDIQRLADYHKITWIDHHKSAIEDLGEIAKNWPGIRNVDEAACVLTWQYFFPQQPTPKAVILIGDRDIWRWEEKETGAFNEGLHQANTNPYNDELWSSLLDDDPIIVEELIEHGAILRDARLRSIHSATTNHGFPVTFEGHLTLAINMRGSGDLGEHIRNRGFKIGYCYIDNFERGEINTYVTLYSDSVDVSEIAKRFGGGGHAGAAGFHFKRVGHPFPPQAQVTFETI